MFQCNITQSTRTPNMTTFEHVFIGESTEEQKKYHKKVV